MRPRKFMIVGLLAIIGLGCYELTYQVPRAGAIPAFARKYDFACNVCHVPSFPKLNDFGNLFRDHGYQLGTDQELPTWEGLTKGYWPVSFRTTVGYQLQSKGGQFNATTGFGDVTSTSGSFGFTGLDILSFGILHRDITFGIVLTPDLHSAGFNTGSSDGDLESAFIKLDNLQRFVGLGDNNYLMNLKVGKFELDLPFSEKRSPTLNTPFLIYHYVAGTPFIGGGLPGITNPNDFGLGDNHPGAELAGIAPTAFTNGYFRYSLNALSNSDVNQGQTGGGRAFQFYGHVTQSFGGYGVVSGQRIGLYGMAGQAPTLTNASVAAPPGGPTGTGENNQTFSRAGIDVSLTWLGQVNVFGTWMVAKDSQNLFLNNPNVTLVGNAQEAHWNGGFIEADYNPIQLPKWLFIYRYDWITNTQQPDSASGSFFLPDGSVVGNLGNFNNAQQHTVGIRYNFHFSNRTDIALHLEFSDLRQRHTAASGGDQRQDTMLAGLDFAF
jgi:hypothetical protein